MNVPLMFSLCLSQEQYKTLQSQFPDYRADKTISEACLLFSGWRWEVMPVLRGTRVYYDDRYYIQVTAPEADDPEYIHLAVKCNQAASRFPIAKLDLTIRRGAWVRERMAFLRHALQTIELQSTSEYPI